MKSIYWIAQLNIFELTNGGIWMLMIHERLKMHIRRVQVNLSKQKVGSV